MHAIIAIILLLLSKSATAGLFAEIGIARADGGSCILDYNGGGDYGCSASPLGSVAIGYAWRGFAVEAEHFSALQHKDRGLNLFSFKYRWEQGK
jgi:hypothetical protein